MHIHLYGCTAADWKTTVLPEEAKALLVDDNDMEKATCRRSKGNGSALPVSVKPGDVVWCSCQFFLF
jgi:hypothetical protein